ncbi:periplasmic septal ring factor with murein hydrolase activity EnvC/YibP [Sulfuriferula multivorans]|uniref:Periplasmic septal ring factor with murein hydrolase activity EnvC/YibP n=1 Tax=Sulfuriferula multivorans TaxID=1559896 RepID=A0A401JH59_9PROT|nr:periplasmic septal ring factor with murein hydrolase activity EnvC/YibP [Sulfuriferula multivorans]
MAQSLAQLRAESDATKLSVTHQQQQLAQLLNQQYMNGRDDPAKLLMNGQDPNQLTRDLRYYAYLAQARSILIANLQAGLTRLDNLAQAQQQKQSQIDNIRQQRLAQRQQLETQREEKRRVIDKLGVQIQSQRKEIATLERNEKHLTQVIEALAKAAAQRAARKAAQEKAAAARKKYHKPTRKGEPEAPRSRPETPLPEAAITGTPFGRLKGRLELPVHGELVHRFGTPRERGGSLWKGLFFKANTGQPVHVVAAGRVVFADWMRGFGNLIIVDHGSGYMSLYSNNETLYKQVGDAVSAGETIAAVGNSGGDPDAGLYFELRYQSRAFDPMSWMAGK